MAEAPKESLEELERRHKQEVRDLEGKVRALLKTAKKSNKAVVEAEAIQMQFDLKARHNEEYDALVDMEGLNLDDDGSAPPMPMPSSSSSSNDAPDAAELKRREEEAITAKRAKAQKKKEKKVAKEEERQHLKEEISASAGPSMREMEMARLSEALSKQNLVIKEIPSDGHCLYRSVADQLAASWLTAGPDTGAPSSSSSSGGNSKGEPDYVALRAMAAAHMRTHADDFAPFLGMLPDDPEYAGYCDKVASVADAEWGGQLEIRALCFCLGRKMEVYAADSPMLTMGEEAATDGKPPLKLAFHRHYYALGEHYNSIVPKTEPCTCSVDHP